MAGDNKDFVPVAIGDKKRGLYPEVAVIESGSGFGDSLKDEAMEATVLVRRHHLEGHSKWNSGSAV